MVLRNFSVKYGFLTLAMAVAGVLFGAGEVFAVSVDETFVFKSAATNFAVEYQGAPTGEPPYNSGVNYFDTAGPVTVVSPSYQARVFVPENSSVSSPFPVEGFAWNETWGWVSFKCSGGFNRGQACGGI